MITGNAADSVLQGLGGNDTLNDTGGKNVFDAGSGTDALTGTTSNEIFLGGTGDDSVDTGTGADIIAFNQGDGQDTVAASSGQDNTVSLGGGIKNTDLTLNKVGNDLKLGTGAGEGLTFKDWYAAPANRSVLNLQMIEEASADFDDMSADKLINKKIVTFNFAGIADAFDLAGTPTDWEVMETLLNTFLLAGSDTAALGGDLAYIYGKALSLTGLALTPVQGILADSNFGAAAQALQPLPGLQSGLVKLA